MTQRTKKDIKKRHKYGTMNIDPKLKCKYGCTIKSSLSIEIGRTFKNLASAVFKIIKQRIEGSKAGHEGTSCKGKWDHGQGEHGSSHW